MSTGFDKHGADQWLLVLIVMEYLLGVIFECIFYIGTSDCGGSSVWYY